MSIAVDNVVKRFGNFAALNEVGLEAKPGEFLALLGPSGSGKTTLLRIMAGLEFPDSGTVLFEGNDVTGIGVRDRRIGFVFQHYALFPHMNVADNVAFGLTVKRRRERPKRAEIQRRAQELLDLVQLGPLGKRYPAQLSGGQRQRVALARALAVDPKLLLLDEPFGALDAKVRKELRRWLRDLHDRMGLTSVFVTHDQEEALELADRVVVMNEGLIEQVAGPRTIYDEPATAFVYDFVGDFEPDPGDRRPGPGDVRRSAGRRSGGAGARRAGPALLPAARRNPGRGRHGRSPSDAGLSGHPPRRDHPDRGQDHGSRPADRCPPRRRQRPFDGPRRRPELRRARLFPVAAGQA